MEIEIGQAVAQQEALTSELPCLPAWEGDANVFSLGAVDLRLLDALEVIDGLGNAILQLGNWSSFSNFKGSLPDKRAAALAA